MAVTPDGCTTEDDVKCPLRPGTAVLAPGRAGKQIVAAMPHGSITLSGAIDAEDNILRKLTYPGKRIDFCTYLYSNSQEIEAIVSHHLNVPKTSCRISWVNEWINGSFNVCVPVYVEGIKEVMVRFPLPYKIGEETHPGNAEEKLRCEAATYAWIRSNCPSIPIPRLWGFGLPKGPCFTALDRAPLASRLKWHIQRMWSWILRNPRPSHFVTRPLKLALSSGYLVVEFVRNGRMLSETWKTLRDDHVRRKTIYSDLSRIMLELARTPFDRIGSLTIDDACHISLTNRPLTLELHELENEGAQTGIKRDLTYPTTDTYLLNLLACHDNRIRHVPNAIFDPTDGQTQLSALTIMRALLPHMIDRIQVHGPFVLMLTDLHQSNVFVDEDWRVTYLIDLEWICSRPVEMLLPPYWLTGQGIDEITGEHLDAFQEQYDEFVSAFEDEAIKVTHEGAHRAERHIIAMRKAWKTGRFWYMNAIESVSGLYNLFSQHIRHIYGGVALSDLNEFNKTFAPYWAPRSSEFIAHKLKERDVYLEQLRDVFESGAIEAGSTEAAD